MKKALNRRSFIPGLWGVYGDRSSGTQPGNVHLPVDVNRVLRPGGWANRSQVLRACFGSLFGTQQQIEVQQSSYSPG
jgi:hypothetical protein